MRRAALLLSSLLTASVAYAQVLAPVQLPALDDGGLIAMIALVGIIGGLVARRRRK